MIKFNKDDIADINLLSTEEAKALVVFLMSERRRHSKDVDEIDEKIRIVIKKFGLEIKW